MCPLVLELRADLRFVTVFFMIGILVNVSCVSTRFRVQNYTYRIVFERW